MNPPAVTKPHEQSLMRTSSVWPPSAKECFFPAAKGHSFCTEDLTLLRCKYEAFHHHLIFSEWTTKIVEKLFGKSLLPTSLEQQWVWQKTKAGYISCCAWAITAENQGSFPLKSILPWWKNNSHLVNSVWHVSAPFAITMSHCVKFMSQRRLSVCRVL